MQQGWIGGNRMKYGVVDRFRGIVHLTILQIEQNNTKSKLILAQLQNFLNIWSHGLKRGRNTHIR
jgi:hypothetical protein